MTDAIYGSYMAAVAFDKFGCVAYGCCWGKEMATDAWYATYYTSPNSKVLRMRPDLKGKPLFPISTLMAGLFMKNNIICVLWAIYLPYFPGVFTALIPILNGYDKDIYFPKRGDSGGDDSKDGYDVKEDFYMVAQAAKKAHVVKWSAPSRYMGLAARSFVVVSVAYALFSSQALVYLSPMEHISKVPDTPHYLAASVFSFCTMFVGTGYHYKELGVWMPRSNLIGKAKQ